MTDSAIFFVRHYNDIDHIVPVVWGWLQADNLATVVLLDPTYDVETDSRLRLLADYDRCEITHIQSLLGLSWAAWLFRTEANPSLESDLQTLVRRGFAKLDLNLKHVTPTNIVRRVGRRGLRELEFTIRRATQALRAVDPDVCIFEWNPPDYYAHAEFFAAAQRLGVATVSLPHGLNIFLNIDVHPGREATLENGGKPMADRNRYDAHVVQSEHHREHDITLGVDPDNCHVLGSARYYPVWQQKNAELHGTFEPPTSTAGKTEVVFMLPHWDFFVDGTATFRLIRRLADHEDVWLVVKSHTRDATGLPEELVRTLHRRSDTAIIAEEPSVELIKWASAVVNFGSSIGIEALLQDTHLINPSYLHDNPTIFEQTGAALQADSNTDVIETVESIHAGEQSPVPDTNKDELYEHVVYGGRDAHDVLDSYVGFLVSLGTGSTAAGPE